MSIPWKVLPVVVTVVSAAVLATPVVGASQEEAAPEEASASLYQRLGGYDALAAVTDDFIRRMAQDERLGRFFTGLSTDSAQRLRQHVVDQLCAATGGPCIYTGRDMKTSHAGLGITEEDWNAAVAHLVGTLDAFQVPERERQDLFAILGTVKGDIVEASTR